MRVGMGVDIAGGGARIHHNTVRANNCNAPTEAIGGVINIFDTADKNGVSYAIIEDNTIADKTLVGLDGEGGAFAIGHNSTIRNNLIARNSVLGTTHPGEGAAFEIWNGEVHIEGNRIVNNAASHEGGGLYLYSVQAAGVVPHVSMVNNILMDNAAGTFGGGVYATENDVAVIMVNNTFTSNTAGAGGSGVSVRNGAIIRTLNTILWDPAGSEIDTGSAGSIAVRYSDIHGGFSGTGNISADPSFVSGDSLCNLRPSSPCIGRGIDSLQIAGVWCHAPSFDVDGHPRPRPVGTQRLDIGAQEEQLTITDVASSGLIPLSHVLCQNFPNPFNPSTVISFQMPVASNVRLVVYDLIGREVTVLLNEKKAPGSYDVRFDATGLSSGVYLYRLTAGTFVQTRKMILVR